MSYWAPGNIYAERGTLAFIWRSRYAVGPTAFPIFRVGYADHSSWDMAWLRIDYNGRGGFDAFVTDANLSRIRVSYELPTFPKPDEWVHLALAWDETRGIRFYVNGALVAKSDARAVLYAGLDQFGPHSRTISPMQVQSDYNFVRGGDLDELRVYDRMLSDENVASVAKGVAPREIPSMERDLARTEWRDEWWLRYGWNRAGDAPPYLASARTAARKVEIHDAFDLKRWWWKGTDGIRETTWPGVYNRSRLAGRNDYFQLPDWDCYSLSGKAVTFTMPDEPWNHLEISGAAWGRMKLEGGRVAVRAAEGSGEDFPPSSLAAARAQDNVRERRAGAAHRRAIGLQRHDGRRAARLRESAITSSRFRARLKTAALSPSGSSSPAATPRTSAPHRRRRGRREPFRVGSRQSAVNNRQAC